MVRGRTLSGLVRHSERPHDALGRDRWLGVGVPPAGDEQQRPHRRPPGAARLVRASQPLRLAHRVRRHAHGAGRPLRRQALQLAERRRRQERRQHLVHRSELRHRLATTKATRRPARSARSNVYRIDPASGRVSVVASDFVQPNGLAFSPDESLLYIADTGAHAQGRRAASRAPLRVVGRRRARSRAARCSPPARSACTTAFASTCTATCGCRPATACTATRQRRRRCSARC